MNKSLTASVTKLSSLFNLVEENGIDREDLLKRVGLDSSLLDSPDNRLTIAQIQRLTQEALIITKDEYLGLHQGERFISFSNILGYVMLTCQTLLEALEKFIRYQQICDETTLVKLERLNDSVCLQVNILDATLNEDFHLSDYRLAGIYTYLKKLTGVAFDLNRV